MLQLRQAKSPTDRKRLADATLRLVNVALAFMTKAYCSVFSKAAAALGNENTLAQCVDAWVRMGTE